MIYFYTDLVAKAWLLEIGSGSPMEQSTGVCIKLKGAARRGDIVPEGLKRDD